MRGAFRFTPAEVDALDDDAFLVIKPGGARDSQGRTLPRPLRVGPHHDPGQRVSRGQVLRLVAGLNAGSLPLSRQERVAAWDHLAGHAAELGIRMPPRRF